MNDQQLIAKLKSCKNGMFVIPLRSDVEKVHDLWDEHVSRRDRRTLSLTVTVCGTGMTAHVGPREGLVEQRHDVVVLAIILVFAITAMVFAVSCLTGPYSQRVSIDLDARHECVRQLGEDCTL